MKKEYAGLHAALVTPYTETGEVNYRELKKLVRRLIAEGIDGFYVGGSTAETFLLTESERKGILEAVLEENNGEKLVVSHVGAISTRQAVDFAQHAEAAGADAVSAISPFYYKFTQRRSRTTTRDHGGSGLPMFVYNFPNLVALTEPFLERLKSSSRLPIKFTADMFSRTIKARNPASPCGTADEMLLSGLAAGADGGGQHLQLLPPCGVYTGSTRATCAGVAFSAGRTRRSKSSAATGCSHRSKSCSNIPASNPTDAGVVFPASWKGRRSCAAFTRPTSPAEADGRKRRLCLRALFHYAVQLYCGFGVGVDGHLEGIGAPPDGPGGRR
ncbi:MAG: dihydrodipicolinate synthase family protein [Anaerotruncus massiliensis (ex Togo et al. 2019)]